MDNFITVLDEQCAQLLEDFDNGVTPEVPNNKSLTRRKETLPKIDINNVDLDEGYLTELENLLVFKQEFTEEKLPLQEEKVVVQEKKPYAIKENCMFLRAQ